MMFRLALLPIMAVISGPAAAQPAPAAAVCTPPPPMPSAELRPPPAPVKPAVPACIDLQTHRSSCPVAELRRYNTAVNQFNADISLWNRVSGDYIDLLNAWTQASSRYAMCEVNAVNSQILR